MSLENEIQALKAHLIEMFSNVAAETMFSFSEFC